MDKYRLSRSPPNKGPKYCHSGTNNILPISASSQVHIIHLEAEVVNLFAILQGGIHL